MTIRRTLFWLLMAAFTLTTAWSTGATPASAHRDAVFSGRVVALDDRSITLLNDGDQETFFVDDLSMGLGNVTLGDWCTISFVPSTRVVDSVDTSRTLITPVRVHEYFERY